MIISYVPAMVENTRPSPRPNTFAKMKPLPKVKIDPGMNNTFS
jgi:hypothetical protein